IAAEAGVAPGLVHYYFKSKEELVLAAIDFACRQLTTNVEGDPESAAWSAFDDTRRRLAERRDFHRLLFDMAGLAMHNDTASTAVRHFFAEERAQTEPLVRAVLAQREEPASDAPAIATAVTGGVFGIV